MIAITGSHGFVGKGLMAFASREPIPFRAIPRESYLTERAFEGCEVVIHLAGLAHRKSAKLEDFMEVNCDLALKCARTAAGAGAKRFIYVSSSKALREFAENDQPLKESELASPGCDYGRSKLAAERGLLALHREGVIEIVIVRPALVIGSPAKANLRTLAQAARWTRRFPWSSRLAYWVFSSFQAPKSYTGLENLCSALICIAQSRGGAGSIFHVVEDQVISTSSLFNRLVNAEGTEPRRPHLASASSRGQNPGFLSSVTRHVLTFLGMRQTYNALALPFVLDGKGLQRELDWEPHLPIDVELQRIMANLTFSEEGSKG
jgi:nucleoside-diphosphate-sugar epimerase